MSGKRRPGRPRNDRDRGQDGMMLTPTVRGRSATETQATKARPSRQHVRRGAGLRACSVSCVAHGGKTNGIGLPAAPYVAQATSSPSQPVNNSGKREAVEGNRLKGFSSRTCGDTSMNRAGIEHAGQTALGEAAAAPIMMIPDTFRAVSFRYVTFSTAIADAEPVAAGATRGKPCIDWLSRGWMPSAKSNRLASGKEN